MFYDASRRARRGRDTLVPALLSLGTGTVLWAVVLGALGGSSGADLPLSKAPFAAQSVQRVRVELIAQAPGAPGATSSVPLGAAPPVARHSSMHSSVPVQAPVSESLPREQALPVQALDPEPELAPEPASAVQRQTDLPLVESAPVAAGFAGHGTDTLGSVQNGDRADSDAGPGRATGGLSRLELRTKAESLSRSALDRAIHSGLRYPPAAKRRGVEGESLVHIRIAADGTLEASTLMRSSGSRLLDDEALRALPLAFPVSPPPGQPLELDYTIVFSLE